MADALKFPIYLELLLKNQASGGLLKAAAEAGSLIELFGTLEKKLGLLSKRFGMLAPDKALNADQLGLYNSKLAETSSLFDAVGASIKKAAEGFMIFEGAKAAFQGAIGFDKKAVKAGAGYQRQLLGLKDTGSTGGGANSWALGTAAGIPGATPTSLMHAIVSARSLFGSTKKAEPMVEMQARAAYAINNTGYGHGEGASQSEMMLRATEAFMYGKVGSASYNKRFASIYQTMFKANEMSGGTVGPGDILHMAKFSGGLATQLSVGGIKEDAALIRASGGLGNLAHGQAQFQRLFGLGNFQGKLVPSAIASHLISGVSYAHALTGSPFTTKDSKLALSNPVKYVTSILMPMIEKMSGFKNVNMGNAKDVTAAIMQHFGRAVPSVVAQFMATIMARHSQITMNKEGISKSLGIKAADLLAARSYYALLQKISAQWDTFKIKIGLQLLPLVEKFLEKLEDVTKWLASLGKKWTKIMGQIAIIIPQVAILGMVAGFQLMVTGVQEAIVNIELLVGSLAELAAAAKGTAIAAGVSGVSKGGLIGKGASFAGKAAGGIISATAAGIIGYQIGKVLMEIFPKQSSAIGKMFLGGLEDLGWVHGNKGTREYNAGLDAFKDYKKGNYKGAAENLQDEGNIEGHPATIIIHHMAITAKGNLKDIIKEIQKAASHPTKGAGSNLSHAHFPGTA